MPIESPWWNELTDTVILSACKQPATGKIGQLIGTSQGIVFETKSSTTDFPWNDIKKIEISRSTSKRGPSASVSIFHRFVTSFESENVSDLNGASLDLIAKRMVDWNEERARILEGAVSFGAAKYLGGLPERASVTSGMLTLDKRCVTIDGEVVLLWSDCNAVAVESEQVAKSKLGAVLAFGILGALTAKDTMSQSVLTVRRKDDAMAYFSMDEIAAHEVKARIASLLKSIGMPMVEEMSSETSPGMSVASEIERLVALKAAGHLDDDEFTKLKAKLLD